jgi:Tfp pilus assembly protein PilF
MPVGVPAPLQQILQRALSKDPNLRYQNAATMAADLRAEKFALGAAPQTSAPGQGGRTAPLNFNGGQPMNTGTVPPEISGLPAAIPPAPFASFPSPSSPAPSSTTPVWNPTQVFATSTFTSILPASASAAPGRRLSPAWEKFLSLGLPLLGLLALLALIGWGLQTVIVSLQAHQRRSQAEHLSAEAASALRQGDYSDAASRYAQAASAAPPSSPEATRALAGQSQAYAAQGQDAARTNNLPLAAEAYGSAVAIDATNASAWNSLGNTLWQQGDIPSALDAWEKAVVASPTSDVGKEASQSAVGHCMDLAQSAASAGNAAQARNYWQRVIQIDPGSDEAVQAAQNINRTEPSSVMPPGGGSAN